MLEKELALNQDIARVGLRYSPTPNSDLLFSFIYSDREERLTETDPGGFFGFDLLSDNAVDDEGYQLEAQYLYRRDRFNVTAGFAYTDVDREFKDFFAVDFFGDLFTLIDEKTEREIKHRRGYVYVNVNLPDPVTWTLGVSVDDYDEAGLEVKKVSPKVGVQWDITEALRLRAALFRTVKPALVANRTIEPTQVAGFNQFFDDINATASFRYGVGLDWRLTKDLSVGAEATWRDLDEPVFDNGDVVFEDRDEQFHRAYLNWTPLPELALSGEFVFDRYTSKEGLDVNLPKKVRTISVPLVARYFHPSGFFTGVGATYVRQKVDRPAASTRGEGTDDFVVVDASVGWRLPNRRGIISLVGRNLLDRKFRFQDDSFREFKDEPSIGPYIPARTFLAQFTLNF